MVRTKCPSCHKAFCFPKRYITEDNLADLPYLPVPRILSCLHAVCQSCLDENMQRNESGSITCPMCSHIEDSKNIMTLPLDYVTAKELLKSSSEELLSHCAKCYDEVRSFSWCFSCNMALCEFHHQDHKLSLETAKHEVFTSKEQKFRKVVPRPCLFPVPCVEVPRQDCALYCIPCKQLISIAALSSSHRGHEAVDFKAYFSSDCQEKIVGLFSRAIEKAELIEDVVSNLQTDIQTLSTSSAATVADINTEFDKLKKALESRQKKLVSRVKAITEKKSVALQAQVSNLQNILKDSKRAARLSSSLLGVSENEDEKENEAAIRMMHGCCSMQTLVKSIELIEKKVSESDLKRSTNPNIYGSFDSNDVAVVKAKLTCLGAIETDDVLNELFEEPLTDLDDFELPPVIAPVSPLAAPPTTAMSPRKSIAARKASVIRKVGDLNLTALGVLASVREEGGDAAAAEAGAEKKKAHKSGQHRHRRHHSRHPHGHLKSSRRRRRGADGLPQLSFTLKSKSSKEDGKMVQTLIVEAREFISRSSEKADDTDDSDDSDEDQDTSTSPRADSSSPVGKTTPRRPSSTSPSGSPRRESTAGKGQGLTPPIPSISSGTSSSASVGRRASSAIAAAAGDPRGVVEDRLHLPHESELLGQVVILIEVDNSLNGRLEIRSFMESSRVGHVPYMTISKQLVDVGSG